MLVRPRLARSRLLLVRLCLAPRLRLGRPGGLARLASWQTGPRNSPAETRTASGRKAWTASGGRTAWTPRRTSCNGSARSASGCCRRWSPWWRALRRRWRSRRRWSRRRTTRRWSSLDPDRLEARWLETGGLNFCSSLNCLCLDRLARRSRRETAFAIPRSYPETSRHYPARRNQRGFPK